LDKALHSISSSGAETRWDPPGVPLLIGQSSEMVDVRAKIQRLSGMKANVLLTGEKGSGKELIARAIHFHSFQSKGPMVRMSCRDLSTEQLDRQVHTIQLAQGGSLFIDEVDIASPRLQEKLLMILKEMCISGIDNTSKERLDIRLLAASNFDLEKMVKLGAFRDDLYKHLRVIHIRVSPLRERKEDIPLLVRSFLQEYCLKLGKKILNMPGGVAEFFLNYSWPGNAIELENVVRRAIILGDWSFVFNELKLEQPSVALQGRP
jgi:DNA-binding NtrC family response regulator